MGTCNFDYVVVDFNVKAYDIWEGNMTIGSEIQHENICSLGFRYVGEGRRGIKEVDIYGVWSVYLKILNGDKV